MIDKLFTAEYLPENTAGFQVIRKNKKDAEKVEIWMLFSGSDESADLADQIWKTLETAYFETVGSEDPYDRFEESLKIVNAQIASDPLLKNADFLQKHSVLLGLFAEGALHLSVLGNAEAYLIRQGKLSIISEGLAPREITEEIFANIASGEIEHDDKVIFSSERLLRHATASQLAEMLSAGTLEGQEALKELLTLADDPSSFVIFHGRSTSETLPFETPKTDARKQMFQNFKAAPFLGKGLTTITSFWDELRAGNQKYFLGAVLGVLGLLLVIIFLFSFSDSSNDEQYEEYRTMLSEARQALSDVEGQEALGDTERANSMLEKADRDLEEILKAGMFRSEALDLRNRANELRDQINNITRISSPKELVNLKTEKENVAVLGVLPLGDDWYAYDAETAFRVVLDSVANVLPLPSGVKVKNGAASATLQTLVFSDTRNRIYEYAPEEREFTLSKTSDTLWKKNNGLQSFSKNIYLLSPDDDQIWKYERGADSYGAAIPYLKSEYDLSKALYFTIDGNIFVLMNDGSMTKFFNGEEAEYELAGAPEGIMDGVTQLYTDENLEYLLFLNPEKSAVYVFSKGEKGATYVNQIVFENVGKLQAMYAKAPKTLMVADESKLYEIPL